MARVKTPVTIEFPQHPTLAALILIVEDENGELDIQLFGPQDRNHLKLLEETTRAYRKILKQTT